MGFTKVGPPERRDLPRKRGFVERLFSLLYMVTGFGFIMRSGFWFRQDNAHKAARMILDDQYPYADDRPDESGLPEADLTEAQRRDAVERIRRQAEQERSEGR